MAEEFGLDPNPELTALYEQIQADEIDVESSVSTTVDGEGRSQIELNKAQYIRDVDEGTAISEPFPGHKRANPTDSIHGKESGGIPQKAYDPPTNIPVPITPLVGREEELAFVHQRLVQEGCRLLTLVGPGGIGKTRLAQELARQLWQVSIDNGLFADGVYFVELVSIKPSAATTSTQQESGDTGLRMGESIIQAILDTLELPLNNQTQPIDHLARYLNRRKVLLLLDNIEHLVDGAEVLSDLLTSTPELTILVTSRVQLALYGEQSLLLNGLPCSVPNGSSAGVPDPEELTAAESLFIQQAQLIDHHFLSAITDSPAKRPSESARQTLAQVARICQLINGIPLAIEMAANWISLFDCKTIVAELESGNELLQSQQRNTPSRHQSMQVVFDYSWQLLNAEDQEILLRLSFFQGSFSYEAARQVGKASLSQVSALMRSSWLWQTRGKRYQIHELVRQYLAEKRIANDALDSAVKRDHASYFAQWLKHAPTDSMGCADNDLLNDMDIEQANLDQAWLWSLENQQPKVVEQLSEGMMFYHFYRGTFRHGGWLFAKALSEAAYTVTSNAASSLRGRLLIGQAYLFMPQFQFKQARSAINEALTLLDEDKDAWHSAFAYLTLHETLLFEANKEQPAVSLHQLCDIFSNLGDPIREAHAWGLIGAGEALRSNYRSGHLSLQNALKISRQIKELNFEANILFHLGLLAYRERRLEQAIDDLTQASSLARQRKLRHNEIMILQALLEAQLLAGQLEAIRHNVARIEEITGEIDSSSGRLVIAFVQAVLHMRSEQYDDALVQMQRALAEVDTASLDVYHACNMYSVLGRIYCYRAMWHEAKKAFTNLKELAASANDVAQEISALAGFGEIALAEEQQAEACAQVDNLLALLPQSYLHRSSVSDYQYVYLTSIQVLELNGDARATRLLTEAYTHLQNQANQVQDLEMRHSFLTKVPSNAAIVELYRRANP